MEGVSVKAYSRYLVDNSDRDLRVKLLTDRPPISWRLGSGIKGILHEDNGMQSVNNLRGRMDQRGPTLLVSTYPAFPGAARI